MAGAVQADMLSDKRRGAHPSPPKGRGARDKHLHVQADMLSACLEYEDILSDIQRGAHPNPFPSKARLPVAFPQGRGARDKHLHVQADMLSACREYKDILSDNLASHRPC